jgi:hypothetical protein
MPWRQQSLQPVVTEIEAGGPAPRFGLVVATAATGEASRAKETPMMILGFVAVGLTVTALLVLGAFSDE